MSDDDHLSNEVTVIAKLEENGLSASATSRAIAGFDRLVGSLFDVPAAYFEGVAGRARERNAVREAVIQAAGKQVVCDDAIIQAEATRLLRNVSAKQFRAAENKAAVAQETLELLSEATVLDDEETTAQIEDDWLNVFERHAEDASSEQLRELWAKILANEVRKPGQFSLSTMRVVAELDRKIAELFEKHVATVFGNTFLPLPRRLEGELLAELNMLEEVGLFSSVASNLSAQITFENGVGTVEEADLLLQLNRQGKTEIQVKSAKLTRSGSELLRILPTRNSQRILENLFEHLNGEVDQATLLRITDRMNANQVRTMPLKVLKNGNQS